MRSTWSSTDDDHVPWFDPDETLAEIREFLTGQREAATPDRILATVLFTDLVGSTERAAELGDRRWRDLLEQHHASIRRELARFDGREVDTAGDGFFATFDGPARGDPLRAGDRRGRQAARPRRPSGPAHGRGRARRRQDRRDRRQHRRARRGAGRRGEVLVSGTVKDLVAGSGLEFEDRGTAALKGVPGRVAPLRRRALARERECGLDDADVRERLREVADEPPALRVVLLGDEAYVVAEPE